MIPMLHLHLVCKLCTLPGAVTQIKRKAVFPAFLWQGNPCGRRIPRRFPRPTGLCGAPLIRFPCRALTEHAAGAIQHCETGMQVKAGRKAIIRNGQSSMHLCTRLPIALQPQRFCLKPVAQMITHICKYAAGYPLARFVAKPGEVAGNPPFSQKLRRDLLPLPAAHRRFGFVLWVILIAVHCAQRSEVKLRQPLHRAQAVAVNAFAWFQLLQ